MARKRADRVVTINGRNVVTIMDTLTHRLRKMVRSRKGHLPELVAKSGLSREILAKINNGTAGNPTLETAVRIAESCGYTLIFKMKEERKFDNTTAKNRNRTPEARAARSGLTE